MQNTAPKKGSSRMEQFRIIRAVEQLRTIDQYIEMALGLVNHLSGFYFDAWRDLSGASTRIKHALFVLDGSGESEHIMDKRWGV